MAEKKQPKTRSYNIKQAQANFDRLIRYAFANDEVILMRRTTPVAQLVPVRPNATRIQPPSGGRP